MFYLPKTFYLFKKRLDYYQLANFHHQGVTFVEILLVVSIIAIIAAAVSPFISNFILINNFEITRDYTIGTLRKAQAYAMSGKNGEIWGVCVTGHNLRLFSGSCNSPNIKEDYVLSETVSISGLNEITFNTRGEPSSSLDINLNTDLDHAHIVANRAGGIELN